MTFGSALQEVQPKLYSSLASDQVYALVAVAGENQAPLPSWEEDPDEEQIPELYLTFLPGGEPAEFNPLDNFSYTWDYIDGAYYYLVHSDQLADYLSQGLYLSVNGGIHYDSGAFIYDPETSAYELNAAYEGIHALFEIRLNEEMTLRLLANREDSLAYEPDLSAPHSVSGDPDGCTVSDPSNDASTVFHYWTAEEQAKLENLSVKGQIGYITENRVITAEYPSSESPAANNKPTVIRIYDYDGNLLHEQTHDAKNLYGLSCALQYSPYCFAIPAGSGFEVYNYDFELLYQFDMAEIPTEYPGTETHYGCTFLNGESIDGVSDVTYASNGIFSENMEYFSCSISVDIDGWNLNEFWLYDSHSGQWKLLLRDEFELQTEERLLVHPYYLVPSNDGRYAVFSAGYYRADELDKGLSVSSTPCYGTISLETGEVLDFYSGAINDYQLSPSSILLDFDYLGNETPYFSLWDTDEMSSRNILPQQDEESYRVRLSPDGRWILTLEHDWSGNFLYTCRFYDTQDGEVEETFTLQSSQGEYLHIDCYPGGCMAQTRNGERIFFPHPSQE